LSFEPARIKVLMAHFLNRILPGLVQPSGLNTNYLSHDPSIVDLYNTDPLVHDKISVSLFASTMKSAGHALSHAGDLKIPLLLIHGSDDKICSPEGSREFALKTDMAELKIWDGGFHELHNEPFRAEVFDYIINWINKPKKSVKG
jgi:alpha-beta hydrolase superfamily lysophospholipase